MSREWKTNKDEALVLGRQEGDGEKLGGVWRGAWMGSTGKVHGFLAAAWNPYRRLGRFHTGREAKAAVEGQTR